MADVTSIDQLLMQMVQLQASDLHITVGAPPVVRLQGHLQRFEGVRAMSADDTRELLYRILSSEQQKRLEINRQLVTSVADFRRAASAARPGDVLALYVYVPGPKQRKLLTVRVDER